MTCRRTAAVRYCNRLLPLLFISSLILGFAPASAHENPTMLQNFQQFDRKLIIDQETIAVYNFASISDALQMVAGLLSSRTLIRRNTFHGRGLTQDLSGSRIGVMINGIPVFSTVSGSSALDRISIFDVERLEVVLGPAALHEQLSAVAGHVNIILKHRDTEHLQVHSALATGISYDVGINFEYTQDYFSGFLGGSVSRLRGNAVENRNSAGEFVNDLDQIIMGNMVSLSKFYNLSLLANYSFIEENLVDGLGASEPGSPALGSSKDLLLSLTFDEELGEEQSVRAGLIYDRSAQSLADVNAAGHRIAAFASLGLSVDSNLMLNVGMSYESRYAGNILTIEPLAEGFRYLSSDISSSNNLYGVNASLEQESDDLSLRLALRFDDSEHYEATMDLEGAVIYRIDQHQSARLSLRRSHRWPSFAELFSGQDDSVRLSPYELQPEIGATLELGYALALSPFYFETAFHRTVLENPIVALRDNAAYVNAASRAVNGMDALVRWQLDNLWSMRAGYALNHVLEPEGDSGEAAVNDLAYPTHSIAIGSELRDDGTFASALLRFQSQLEGQVEVVPAQWALDLHLGFRHESEPFQLQHSFSIRNVLNLDQHSAEYRASDINDLNAGFGRILNYTLRVSVE